MTDFRGTSGPDTLVGAATNDRLFGGHGDDVLDGAGGNDALYGGEGNDTYLFRGRFGDDRVAPDVGGAADRILLGGGIAANQVRLVHTGSGRYDDDLLIFVEAGSRRGLIQLQDHFADAAPTIEKLEFADGTVWDLRRGLRLKGGDDDDRLEGTIRNDTLEGAGGDDSLVGGRGNDTYLFRGAFGEDRVARDTGGSDDRILLGTGITAGDVRLVHTGTDPDGDALQIVVEAGSRGGLITLEEHFARRGPTVERLEFADGTVWDLTGGLRLAGGDGDDRLQGSVHDDTLDGGAGSDRLEGGLGDDTYVFTGSSFGYDVIGADAGGVDAVRLGLSLARTSLLGQGESLLIAESRGRSSVTVEGQYDADGPSIEKLELAGGTTLDLTRGLTFRGGSGGDVISGSGFADTIIGGAGNDYLAGGEGKDTYVFARGWGDDRVVDASGTSTILFEGVTGAELTVEDYGDDRYITRTGSSDTVRLVDFNNGAKFSLKYTEAGFSKIIFGSGGSDVLRDGGGGDVFLGAGGRDTFVFRAASDSPVADPDTILDFGPGDRIDLAAFDADRTASGRQHFAFVDDDRFSKTAGELRFDDGLLSGDTDGDGRADFALVLMSRPGTPASSLDLGDLILG